MTLKSAEGDDRLIIQTQLARTHMLRKDFAAARNILQTISPDVAQAGAEAKARYWLELGRSYASHRHDPATQTPESRRLARQAFSTALSISREGKLDGLAVGEALYDLRRYDEALKYFRRSLLLCEQSGDSRGARDANWRIARVLRVQNHIDDALAIQLRLERESEMAQQPRHYIYEELQLLYQAKADAGRAREYEQPAKALQR